MAPLARAPRIRYLVVGIALLLLILIYLGIRSYLGSHVYSPATKLTIGMWGREGAIIVSLSKSTGQNYVMTYPHSHVIEIPGGLENYKVGALGKVARLESDPRLIKKSLSQLSGLPLDGVLYQDTEEIYYDEDMSQGQDFGDVIQTMRSYVYGSGDLGLFDRLYLYHKIAGLRLSNSEFYTGKQPVEGVFFDRRLRNEKKLIQVKYASSIKTTQFISHLLEHIGIKVADMAKIETLTTAVPCQVMEEGSSPSDTARYITSYFGCEYQVGDTGLYEIVFVLGRVEEEWSL